MVLVSRGHTLLNLCSIDLNKSLAHHLVAKPLDVARIERMIESLGERVSKLMDARDGLNGNSVADRAARGSLITVGAGRRGRLEDLVELYPTFCICDSPRQRYLGSNTNQMERTCL
jgi:hypothetical protein